MNKYKEALKGAIKAIDLMITADNMSSFETSILTDEMRLEIMNAQIAATEALQSESEGKTDKGWVALFSSEEEWVKYLQWRKESESEWISVEDSRKPKDAERVLLYIDYVGGIQVTGYLLNGVWNLPNFIRDKIPTHWMPLPQSPSIKTPKI